MPLRNLDVSKNLWSLKFCLYIAICVWGGWSPLASSQAPLSSEKAASEIIRQQERERQLREKIEQQPDVHLEAQTEDASSELLPEEETPCFPIRSIAIKGKDASYFQWGLGEINRNGDLTHERCLGTRGINQVMKRLQNAIVAKGYVTTRVLAEPQSLMEGVLTLTIVPGYIRTIRFANESGTRGTLWNALPVKAGDLLNLRDIEQGIENLKRVPTADADIQIIPADGVDATPGESDLVILWRQSLPLRLSVNLDDSGTKSTGKNQSSVTISVDHPLALNDLFYFTMNHDLGGSSPGDRGTEGYVAHYSLPLDYWLVSFTTSENTYFQSVAGTNQTYRYSGDSSSSELKLSRLVYRDGVRKSTISIKGWLRTSNNFIDDTEVLVQRRRMAGWELGASHREMHGDDTLDINIAYKRGTGALGSLPAPEEAFGEGTAYPRFFTADVQLNTPFTLARQPFRLTTALRGQWDRTPLVPQDRFSIGGRYTVRGFDGENILSAERGWLIRNDLSMPLGESRQEIYIGLDHGEVNGPSSRSLVGKRLSGAVIGWRGSLMNLSYDFFVGSPIDKPANFKTLDTTTGFSLNWSI